MARTPRQHGAWQAPSTPSINWVAGVSDGIRLAKTFRIFTAARLSTSFTSKTKVMGRKSQSETSKKTTGKRAVSDDEGESADLTTITPGPRTSPVAKKVKIADPFDYEVPDAPELDLPFPPEECAGDLLMQPRPRVAYKIGEGKYAVLAGNGNDEERYVVYIREFVNAAGSEALYPSNQRFVKFDAQQASNFIYECPHLRNLMHDGGPRFGTHVAHIGRRIQASLNPEFGPHLDVRQFYVPKDDVDERPTKKGIRLSLDEFEALCVSMRAIRAKWPCLQKTFPCQMSHAEEQSQEGQISCSYCTPTI